jgi:hypothetical protein
VGQVTLVTWSPPAVSWASKVSRRQVAPPSLERVTTESCDVADPTATHSLVLGQLTLESWPGPATA